LGFSIVLGAGRFIASLFGLVHRVLPFICGKNGCGGAKVPPRPPRALITEIVDSRAVLTSKAPKAQLFQLGRRAKEAAEGKQAHSPANHLIPATVWSGRRPCGGAAKWEDGMILRTLTAALAAALFATAAGAQEAKHYRFAYDQPRNTGYGVVGDVFANKLKELSKGTMLIDQYPGAQLGQEPQVLQMIKSGDVDFCISASANAA